MMGDRGRNRGEIFQDSDQSIIRRHTDISVIGCDNLQFAADGSLYITTPEVPPGGILKLAPGAGSVTETP